MLTTVQLDVAIEAVTAMVPAAAWAVKLAEPGLNEKTGVPGAGADCVTLMVFWATVRVPDLALEVFGATAYVTTPFPEPEAPAVTDSIELLLAAVQEHPVVVATCSV